MSDTYATLPAFFDGLSFELKQVAMALAAGADTREIALWLNVCPSTIAHREAQVVSKYRAFKSAN